MIVICSSCGAKVRLPEVLKPDVKYRCGKCKAILKRPSEDTPIIRETSSLPENDIGEKKNSCIKLIGNALQKISYLHPLLFAVAPILLLYSFNLTEVTPSDLVLPLTAALGLCAATMLLFLGIIMVISRIRTRSEAPSSAIIGNFKKATVITSIFLILFLNFGDALDIIGSSWYVLAIIWIGLLITGIFLIIKTRKNLDNLMVYLLVVGSIIFIMPVVDIVKHEIQIGGQDFKTAQTDLINGSYFANGGTLPDIYYIVPDRYGSTSALELNFDFNNSEFTDYLTSKGFYVVEDGYSNYSRTFASLASSLNMEYINYLSEDLGEDFRANYPMWELIQDNKVWRFLKSKGYTFISLGDKWDGTSKMINADQNYNLFTINKYFSTNEFSWLVFTKTLAYPFCVEQLNIVEDPRVTHYNNVFYHFDKLAEIPNIEEPTFTFVHMLFPHDPYVFQKDGEYKTLGQENQMSIRDNYLDNLTFLNSKLKTLIDELLQVSEVPPIIILQADEGPFPLVGPWLGEEATVDGLKVKMGIINAYYLPGIDDDTLYPLITPVNSFRVVFDYYFNTDLGLLPEKYYAYDDGYPSKLVYRFIDVTDKLNSEN